MSAMPLITRLSSGLMGELADRVDVAARAWLTVGLLLDVFSLLEFFANGSFQFSIIIPLNLHVR